MTKISLDLEIAQTLGVPVALILSLAERENISNLAELKSIAIDFSSARFEIFSLSASESMRATGTPKVCAISRSSDILVIKKNFSLRRLEKLLLNRSQYHPSQGKHQ